MAEDADAFLASMGVSGAGSGGNDKKKKDKRKGKAKSKSSAKEAAPSVSAAGKLVAARQQAVLEEQKRLEDARRALEEKNAEEQRKILAEARRVEEEKKRKAEAKAAKIAHQRENGTYLTKAQKARARQNAERLEAMKTAGIISSKQSGAEVDLAARRKRIVYGKKKKKKPAHPPIADVPDATEASATTDETGQGVNATNAKENCVTIDKGSTRDEATGGWDDIEWDNDSGGLEIGFLGSNVAANLQKEEANYEGEDYDDDSDDDEDDATIKEARDERRREAAKAALSKRRIEDNKTRQTGASTAVDIVFINGVDSPEKNILADASIKEESHNKLNQRELMSKAEEEAYEKKLEARKIRQRLEKEREALRSTEVLRSPIICIMGHVDTGKTKLLDKIRKTNVQDGEAGGITQQIGATYFPGDTLLAKIQKLNALIHMPLKLPGMLVIDTPGHEAFSNLRNRGSSICDIAILVIDLMHGLEQQTIESIEMLRDKKCPFVVALNKVDRCYEWKEFSGMEIRESLAKQTSATQGEFRSRMQHVRVQLMEKGLNAELYWENKEPATTVSLVPTSAHTGEGINDLLHMLTRLSQQHLAQKLSYSENVQCTVLEVKVVDGLGCTLDVILVNGEMRNGCSIVVCTTEGPVVTQVRALLTTPPNRELRIKSHYVHNECIRGAIGIKICAPGLENAVAGSPVMVLPENFNHAQLSDLKDEVMADFQSLASALATDSEGVLACASTLGALEALLVFLRKECDPPIPVSAVSIGPIFKKDVMRAALMHEKKKPEYATILAFDVPVDPDAETEAANGRVTIFTADIIYHLFDQFTRHRMKTLEEEKERAKDVAVFPCLLKILPNMIFNQKDPIILGVEVIDGVLKVGTPLCIPKNGFLHVGRVTNIELNHQSQDRVQKGVQCAIQIVNEGNSHMTYGRQFNAEHALYSELSRSTIDALKKYFKDEMSIENWKLVVKLKKVFSII